MGIEVGARVRVRGRGRVRVRVRVGVAAEAVLQQVGELRVSVGHMLLLRGERGDDCAERRERLVDGLR